MVASLAFFCQLCCSLKQKSVSQYLLTSYKCSDVNKQTQRFTATAYRRQCTPSSGPQNRNRSFIPVCLRACSQVLNFRRLEKKTASLFFFFTAHRESFFFFFKEVFDVKVIQRKICYLVVLISSANLSQLRPCLPEWEECGGWGVHLLLIAKCGVSKEWRVNQKVKFSVQACVFCMTGCCEWIGVN